MLKIKDNVELKELEKFGFKHEKENGYYEINFAINPNGFDGLSISERSRIIYCYTNSIGKPQHILYDLIKADLVEKVEDKGE